MMKRRLGMTASGLSILASMAVWATETNMPATITVPFCATLPAIDANLKDPCWAKAAKLTGLTDIFTGKPAVAQTTFWLCRDTNWLYIAVRCEEPQPGNIKIREQQRDGSVSADDSVELFLAPGAGGPSYYQFILNAGNIQADQRCDILPGAEPRKARYVDLPWRSAAQPDPHIDTATGWSAELAIPLAVLQSSMGPEPWRINLCRTRQAVAPAAYSSLAPLPKGSGFHSPDCFLTVAGLANPPAGNIFGPMLDKLTVKPFEARNGQYAYEIVATVKNETGLGGDVEVVGQDAPTQGQGTQACAAVQLGPVDKKDVTLTFPVDAPKLRSAWVGLRVPGTQVFLQKSQVPGMEALLPFGAYLDRNYYTTETQAWIYAETTMSREALKTAGFQVRVELTGSDKKNLAADQRDRFPAESEHLAIPLTDIPVGRHPVVVSFRDREGRVLAVTDLTLHKLPPPPENANEVKIDRYNRCMLLNGRSFFPIGITTDEKMDEIYVARYAEAGFNTLLQWTFNGGKLTPEEHQARFDRAWQHKLYVIGNIGATCKWFTYDDPQIAAVMSNMVASLNDSGYFTVGRAHPAVIGYYGIDEPPGDNPELTRQAAAGYQRMKELAPYQSVYISLCRVITPGHQAWFDTVADLLGTHNYWEACDPRQLDSIAQWSEMADRQCRKAHSPTMLMNHTENFHAVMPYSHEERRAGIYLSLVHGAKSFIFFDGEFALQQTLDSLKQLTPELRALGPILVMRTPDQTVTFEPQTAFIRGWSKDLDFPIVQTLVKNHPEGGQILLAVNGAFRPVQVTFRLSNLGAGSKVTDFFKPDRAYPVTAGGFSDTFAPLDRRVYRLQNTAVSPTNPIQVHLVMRGEAVEKGTYPDEPKPLPTGSNLLVNPGFEEPGAYEPSARQVADNPHAGQYCLQITNSYWYSSPVELKPETRYQFGGYVRAHVVEGRQGVKLILYDTNTESSGKSRMNQDVGTTGIDQPEWQLLTKTVMTPPAPPVTVQLLAGIVPGKGEVWLDDIFIQEVSAPKRRNLIKNSSFEDQRLPYYPNFWCVTLWGPLIPDETACQAVTNNPYHGHWCFRIRSPIAGAWNAYARTDQGARIPVTLGATYTLSAYLRSDTTNAPVRFMFAEQKTNMVVGAEWQRYAFTAKIPENGPTRTDIAIRYYGANTLWVDAVQFEQGAEPTPYEP